MTNPSGATEMRAALEEAAEAQAHVKIEKVHVPELPQVGGVVHVRTIDADDRDVFGIKEIEAMDAFEEAHGDSKYGSGYLREARLTIACACDEKGERIFGWADLAWVKKLDPSALVRIAHVADEVNVLTAAGVKALLGKSEATPTGSGASSPPDAPAPAAPAKPSEG